MSNEHEVSETADATPVRAKSISLKVVVLLVVIAAFAGVLTAKMLTSRDAAGAGGQALAGSSLTSVHNDAMADYEAALKTGKPVYVLFHSLS